MHRDLRNYIEQQVDKSNRKRTKSIVLVILPKDTQDRYFNLHTSQLSQETFMTSICLYLIKIQFQRHLRLMWINHHLDFQGKRQVNNDGNQILSIATIHIKIGLYSKRKGCMLIMVPELAWYVAEH